MANSLRFPFASLCDTRAGSLQRWLAAVTGCPLYRVSFFMNRAVTRTFWTNTFLATSLVLERASDGARASVALSGRAASAVAVGVGTVVAVSVLGTGVLLSLAGEVLSFMPNELGRALLHNERITD